MFKVTEKLEGRMIFDAAGLKDVEKEIIKSSNILEKVFISLNVAVLVVDPYTRAVLEANRTTEKVFGYSAEELVGLNTELLHVNGEMFGRFGREALDAYDVKGYYETEFFMKRKNGEIFPTEHVVRPLYDTEGNLKHVISVIKDITERKKIDKELKLSEMRYRMVVEDQTELICRFNNDSTIIFANEAYCRFFNKKKEELIGRVFTPEIHQDDKNRVKREIASIGSENSHSIIEYRVLGPDGEFRWLQWTCRAVFDNAGALLEYQVVGRDITESKELEEKLRHFGLHDPLTGLYNRAYFMEEMKRLDCERFLPLCIFVCDLNGLKLVNDTLGHQYGDELIKAAGGVLVKCFRNSDVVARIGGDEFAVILPKTSYESAKKIYERLEKAIDGGCIENTGLPVSIAFGYAIKEHLGQNLETVFAEADNRMYVHKENQRSSVHKMIFNAMMEEIQKIDKSRADHMLRVEELSVRLAEKIGLNEAELKILSLAARYHDVGMVGIPVEVIKKQGPLTSKEYKDVQRHAGIGMRIVEGHPVLKDAAGHIVRHHEWWNGNGYPYGLKGDDIPLISRIIAIADAYDSMTHSQPYRGAMTTGETFDELQRASNSQFDPCLVGQFINMLQK